MPRQITSTTAISRPTTIAAPVADEAMPLHQQVTATIVRQIEQGNLRPGMMLPSETELARQFGVSRQTIRAGLEALARAGLLERHRGRGTLIKRPPIQQNLARFYSIAQEMRRRGAALTTQVLARGHLAEGDELAAPACKHLEMADPQQVGYLLRLRLVDGTPLLLETLTFPVALCPDLLQMPTSGGDDPGAASFYEALATRAGRQVSRAHETFRPALVRGYEAHLLNVAPGTPVFEVERTSFVGEQPVEWRRTLARGDRYSYAVDLLNPVEQGEVGE